MHDNNPTDPPTPDYRRAYVNPAFPVVDLQLGHARIFRSYARGAKSGQPEFSRTWAGRDGRNYSMRIITPEPLDEIEETVLLGVLSLAQERNGAIVVSPEQLAVQQPRVCSGASSDRPTICVQFQPAELLRRIHWSLSVNSYSRLDHALRRLGRVVLEVTGQAANCANDIVEGNALLIHYVRHKTPRACVCMIQFAPRIVAALFKGHELHTISLEERLQLRGDVARHLHAFLSHWSPVGKHSRIELTSLERHVWRSDVEPSPEARRQRLRSMRRALEELSRLQGWAVAVEGRLLTVLRQAEARAA